MTKSVLYITNIPTPYRLPLYRRLAGMLRSRGEELRVFFLGYAKSDRRWVIGEEEMDGFEHATSGRAGVSAMLDARRAIDAVRPRAVILSWAMDQVALGLLLYCGMRGIPCLVVSGETIASAAANPHRALRGIFRVPFFKLAAGFITYGSASAEYLVRAGVPKRRIVAGVNTVDTEFFAREADRLRADGTAHAGRERHRDRDGGELACHFLFVGYLLPEKGADRIIEALDAALRSDAFPSLRRSALHVVGAGPEEDRLRDEAARRGLDDRIFFHGYRQQRELPLYYAMADALIFPSTLEVFGLVLVEGAAAGLPIVASASVGGARDVVEHGLNGFLVGDDDGDLPDAMERLAGDPELRRIMGAASRRRAEERFTIERSAARFLDALDQLTR